MSAEAIAYLSQFSKEFNPEGKGGESRRNKLEALPDGKYTFWVTSSTLEMVVGKPIWRLRLEVNGTIYEHTHWLDSQIAADIAGTWLMGMGVPANTWVKGEFHHRIADAIFSAKGVRFKGEKGTNGKGYAVLRVYDYLGNSEARQQPQAPQPTRQQKPQSSSWVDPAPQAYDDPNADDIPF